MRRETNRVVLISIIVLSVLAVLLIGFLIAISVNSNKENEFAKELSSYDQITEESESAGMHIGKEEEETENASTQIGKSIEETKSEDIAEEDEFEMAKIVEDKTVNKKSNNNSKTIKDSKETNKDNGIDSKETNKDTTIENKEEEKKIDFEAPLKGEIIKEFAKDSLVFSNTLQEWITHTAVDIKADKTSIVKAASDGIVYAIKNDPRYGLTIIINHDNGYQTIYSNLLTTEFVVKGENVKKGQSIGTVGNSAAFEIADDYHLHFELLKNNEYLDPVIYMNFE